MVRAHIRFRGTVQGVGFRYTTLSFAQSLALTGWVKNLPDGSVEAMVEGPRAQIEELVAKLKNQFGSFIRDQQIEWLEVRGEYKDFFVA